MAELVTIAWVALVTTWNPSVERTIEREFSTEKECWDYYETEISPGTTLAESKWGKQNLTSQNKRPDKNFHFKTVNDYPIRTYKGTGESPSGKDSIWLSCEKERKK